MTDKPSLLNIALQEILLKNFVSFHGNNMKMLGFFCQHNFKDFSKCWNNLTLDKYMKDNGKYRLRRYGAFTYSPKDQSLSQQAHHPYSQPNYINPLNGGIDRYFDPLEEKFAHNPFLRNLLVWFSDLFNLIEGKKAWDIRLHPYRILANPESKGLPTPEGIHRDGVDYIISLLINRTNVVGGESRIYDNNKNMLKQITLQNPLDTIIANDRKTMHDVSPILPKALENRAYRNVLVIAYTQKERG